MNNSRALCENRNTLNCSDHRPPVSHPIKKPQTNGGKRRSSAAHNRRSRDSFDKENDTSFDNHSVKSSLDLKKLQDCSVISSASLLRRQSNNSLQLEQVSQAEYGSGGDQNKKQTAYFQSGVAKAVKAKGKSSQALSQVTDCEIKVE